MGRGRGVGLVQDLQPKAVATGKPPPADLPPPDVRNAGDTGTTETTNKTETAGKTSKMTKPDATSALLHGHALMENRNCFAVGADHTHTDGTAERRAAIDMLNAPDQGSTQRITLGADKGYDAAEFVADLRTMCVTPHIAAKAKGSGIDAARRDTWATR